MNEVVTADEQTQPQYHYHERMMETTKLSPRSIAVHRNTNNNSNQNIRYDWNDSSLYSKTLFPTNFENY